MAYFNHAFCKAFLAKTHNQDTTRSSQHLTTGNVAILGADYKVLDAAGVAGTNGGIYIATGSFMANDKIGNNPGHGGYKESIKSKMILKKYISDMWISDCENESPGSAEVIIKPTEANKSCFPCGSDPIFRIDIKGTAALRLLNHNAYASISGSLPALQIGQIHADGSGTVTHPANGVDMCCVEQTTAKSGIAPSIVAANLRDQINNDPILSKFGKAKLLISAGGGAYATPTDAEENAIYAGGAAGINGDGTWLVDTLYKVEYKLLTSCELQTQFTSCSFDTRDFYLMGGLKASIELQDEVGNPCVACQGFVISSVTDFKQRRTSAETAARDILLTEGYRQSPYNQGNKDSSRFREIEQMAGIVDEVGRDSTTHACNGKYRVYHLVHNVPRFNNPTGVFDNDQYVYRLYVPCTGATAATTSLDADWLALAQDANVQKFDGSGPVTSVADLVAKGGNY